MTVSSEAILTHTAVAGQLVSDAGPPGTPQPTHPPPVNLGDPGWCGGASVAAVALGVTAAATAPATGRTSPASPSTVADVPALAAAFTFAPRGTRQAVPRGDPYGFALRVRLFAPASGRASFNADALSGLVFALGARVLPAALAWLRS